MKRSFTIRDMVAFLFQLGPVIRGNIYLALVTFSLVSARGAEMQTVRGHVLGVLKSLAPASHLPSTNRLNLAISLPLRNTDELTNLLREIYNPTSPNYHHYLTTAEFTAEFGPTEQDYQALIDFAKANHLQVTATPPNRMLLDVNGSVAAIEQAFHVTLNLYQHPAENRLFYAPDTEPSVSLSVPILHVSGLDNYALPRPRLQNTPAAGNGHESSNNGSGPSGAYMGTDFRKAYVPDSTLAGSGQAVGLLEEDGYTLSDITYYESKVA